MGLRTFLFVRDCFHFYLLELGCRCGGLFFVHVRVVFFLQLLDVGAEEFFYVICKMSPINRIGRIIRLNIIVAINAKVNR